MYDYQDITVVFNDGDGGLFKREFQQIATDFEIDHFLTKVLPVESYAEFENGKALMCVCFVRGIGEDRVLLYDERHTSIGDLIPNGSGKCTAYLCFLRG